MHRYNNYLEEIIDQTRDCAFPFVVLPSETTDEEQESTNADSESDTTHKPAERDTEVWTNFISAFLRSSRS